MTEKVSFNIASEASYVYILSAQKIIKNAKKIVNFGIFNFGISLVQLKLTCLATLFDRKPYFSKLTIFLAFLMIFCALKMYT